MSKKHKKTGLPPGTVVYTGNHKTKEVLVHYLKYDESTFEQKTFNSLSKIPFPPPSKEKIDWYDVRGMHDTKLIELFGNTFSIHPIALENAVDVHQRPSYEEYEKGNFVTVKAISFNKDTLKISKEHVAIYFRKEIIITFQETDSDLFSSVRNRIETSNGRIRKRGVDYLTYALIDVLVDNYHATLDALEDVIENLEEQISKNQSVSEKTTIHILKKELLVLRKSVAPLREAIGLFSKTESTIVDENTLVFIRNLYDHTIQVMDTIESNRDVLNSLQDLFIAEVSFKMNKIMQLLTLVSTIFIPLTFLAGIYGMNFEYMPELHYKNGYFVLLGVMLILFIALLLLFKKKKWF